MVAKAFLAHDHLGSLRALFGLARGAGPKARASARIGEVLMTAEETKRLGPAD
jgi:hypothetical protein